MSVEPSCPTSCASRRVSTDVDVLGESTRFNLTFLITQTSVAIPKATSVPAAAQAITAWSCTQNPQTERTPKETARMPRMPPDGTKTSRKSRIHATNRKRVE